MEDKEIRSRLLKESLDYCKRTGHPFFMPSSGYCFTCKRDMLKDHDGNFFKSLNRAPTGCHHCHRSYCD